MSQHTTRNCSLEAVVGKFAACPEAACPFWEPGGAVLDPRCAVETLAASCDANLAAWLLEIRARLETASTVEEERTVRGVLHHVLNESDE